MARTEGGSPARAILIGMRCRFAIACVVLQAVSASAQTRAPARKPAPAPVVAPLKVVPDMTCPTPLGVGVNTKQGFCHVRAGRDRGECIRI